MYKSKVNFILPDFVKGFDFYSILLDLYTSHREIFYENANISAIYGCFNACTWNGGTVYFGEVLNKSSMQNIISFYKSFNIPIRLTFTNNLITEDDLKDRYANAILDIVAGSPNGEVLVSSEVLYNYIRNKYPLMKLIRSITASREFPTNEDFDKYFMVVVPKFFNRDFDALKTIRYHDFNKVKLLCNETCAYDCPRAYTHYLNYNRSQLFIEDENIECSQHRSLFPDNFSRVLPYTIQPEDINKYLDLGINNFKISGRNDISAIVEYTVKYLIKPEYQLDVRQIYWRYKTHV